MCIIKSMGNKYFYVIKGNNCKNRGNNIEKN